MPVDMTASPMPTTAPAEQQDDPKTNPSGPKAFKARIERCKRIRIELVRGWGDNVDFRRGKPFHQESDEDRVNVNIDWSLTKGKHAQLYSQTPQVYLTPKAPEFAPAVAPFGKRLNDVLTTADVGAAMDESVLDVINASGIGAVLVSYRASTIPKQVPVDPKTGAPLQLSPEEAQQAAMLGLARIDTVDEVVDVRFGADRFSPSDLLWDVDFVGSNFDHSDFVGRSGRLLAPIAQKEFNLTPEQMEKVKSGSPVLKNLRQDNDHIGEESIVEFDELFYWAYRFDPEEKYFKRIRRIVFIKGLDEPVVDEPWKGQKFDEATRTYSGSCLFPIRILTLTYISDDAIPPSDSAIGRPQVLEMIKSRTQSMQNKDRSAPLRWGNTDRLDPMVLENINRGTVQNIIPVQGDGTKVLGEVARADKGSDDYAYDTMIKGDLQEQWQVSSNQIGAQNPHGQSATEAGILQQNFQTRIGQERARVEKHLVGIAEVMAGLLCLYDNFKLPDVVDQTWDRKTLANEMVFYVRPDSTVLLSSQQRIEKLEKFVNLTGQSGYVNLQPIMSELAALHGLDPAEVIIEPTPPENTPNMSFRFGGAADLMNPIVVAMMLKAKLAPSPDELKAALALMQAAGIPVAAQPQNPAESGLEVPPTDAELEAQQEAEQMDGSDGGKPPISPQDASKGKEFGLMPRISRRVEDI